MNKDLIAIEAPLIDFFNSLNIPFDVYRHQPLFTVEESKKLRGELKGGHCKTLFLKDKKGKLALAVVEENKRVDLKTLEIEIGLGRISFGSPDLMAKVLGVKPGSVTPFGLINYTETKNPNYTKPTLIIDQGLLDLTPLHFHPLHNQATVAITPQNLLKFIKACEFIPHFHKF